MTDKMELGSISNTQKTYHLPINMVIELYQPYHNCCLCLFFALSKMEAAFQMQKWKSHHN